MLRAADLSLEKNGCVVRVVSACLRLNNSQLVIWRTWVGSDIAVPHRNDL